MKLRVFTGGIIAIHGLLRIIFIDKYIGFVHLNYIDIFPSDTLLTIGSAILPFIEFFVGLLITFKVGSKSSILGGIFVSLFMVFFIVVGNLYPRLIYHSIVLSLLATLYLLQKNNSNENIIL